MNEQTELEELETHDADFDAGFVGSPTETPESDLANGGQDDAALEGQGRQEDAPKIRQVTETEWNELSARAAAIDEIRATQGKQFDTAFGKIGGLERVLKQFQEGTPAGQAVEITEDDLAELRDEYPDLVGPQLKAFQRIVGKMRGTSGAQLDEGRVKELIQPSLSTFSDSAVERAKVEMANEALDETHPGWQGTIGLPDEQGNTPDTEFRQWLSTQDQAYQERVSSSFSPVVLGRAIDRFEAHKGELKKKADSQRRDRFDQAVTPKGDGGHQPAPDDDDDFESGFNGR